MKCIMKLNRKAAQKMLHKPKMILFMCPLKLNQSHMLSFLYYLAQILMCISFHSENINMTNVCVQAIIYEVLKY